MFDFSNSGEIEELLKMRREAESKATKVPEPKKKRKA